MLTVPLDRACAVGTSVLTLLDAIVVLCGVPYRAMWNILRIRAFGWKGTILGVDVACKCN